MRDKSLGEQAQAVLRYIAEWDGATVGEVMDGFGEPQGLSRSTIVTVMDRLRAQGYLTRDKDPDGVFRYVPAQPQEELLGWLISRFIEKTLAGRLTALSVYFTRSSKLTDNEKNELNRLLAKMEDGNGK
ncbi:MAG: BlaI/MecI/CopY family transcriptional regulator [Akkermansiaceae bacterium]|nr:BlaI/MecI/CopY family transcriptional regulator [Armatimonadota bacterium]